MDIHLPLPDFDKKKKKKIIRKKLLPLPLEKKNITSIFIFTLFLNYFKREIQVLLQREKYTHINIETKLNMNIFFSSHKSFQP